MIGKKKGTNRKKGMFAVGRRGDGHKASNPRPHSPRSKVRHALYTLLPRFRTGLPFREKLLEILPRYQFVYTTAVHFQKRLLSDRANQQLGSLVASDITL